MAARTFRIHAVLRKLPGVRVLMALMAMGGGRFEVHVSQIHFQVGRLVAINARNGAMPSNQGKRSGGMIKAKVRSPGFG